MQIIKLFFFLKYTIIIKYLWSALYFLNTLQALINQT